jgi:isochorismate pyruvate lyase
MQKNTIKMKKPHECKNLLDIRSEIDLIDDAIVGLIAKRAEYVKCAAKFKKDEASVYDQKRVATVIESKKQLANKYDVSPELIGKVFSTMIDFFVNEELEVWKSIKKTAFQGQIGE